MAKCSVCGAEAASDDAFCQMCGTALKAAAPTVTMVPPAPTARAQSPTPLIAADHRHTGDGVGGSPSPADRVADQLMGRSQPNQMYLGHRLLYQEYVREDFDPLSWSYFREVLRQAGIVTFLSFWLALFPLFLVVVGGSSSNTGVIVVGVIGLLIACPGLWIYFWFHRIPAVKSEWKLLVDDKASAADQVFSHIVWAFKRRQSPVKTKIQRLPQAGGAKRDYLVVKDGIFVAFISAFPYGDDLFIGWALYWNLSPVRWTLMYLKRLIRIYTLRETHLTAMHRYDRAKAMREAVHSAAREGVDAATGAVAFQSAGTIGSDIEVEVATPNFAQSGFAGIAAD